MPAELDRLPQKAACEAEVGKVFGERGLIVRPGLIVGPGDRSGRFSHWPWRALEGGEMLVPDLGDDEPLQFIDVRDLGAWIVRLLERGERGAFNATGPANGPACSWADVVAHAAWHYLAARALAPAAGRSLSVDALFLGEAIASAFDVYLVGRLLGHAPRSTFLETQVPAMAESTA